MEEVRKKIPIGIDDFDKLIRGNYYFADKSMLMKAIIESESSETILLPRPRRFGKSLNMSMMKYFFTNKNAEKNRELFNGLLIEKEESMMNKQGRYPVLYISFKDIKNLSWEECYNKTRDLIADKYRENQELIEKMDMFEKEDFINIASGKADKSKYETSLKFLCELLYKYYGVKPIVLIDEYDQPIIASHINGYFKEGMNFYRNMYSAVLKDNVALEKAVMTGILRVAKESIFSGLNNLLVDSIMNNEINYFGLSEEEVKEMLHHYKMDYEMTEVKQWYNGYVFGKNLVYNPWSIINFVKSGELKPYWVNTSSNDLIRESLSNISKANYDELVKLINGEVIDIKIEENISFETLKSSTTIWNLMLFSGYLSLTEEKGIRFVNKEVRNFYISIFKDLAGSDIGEFNKLLKYLIRKDMKNFKGLLGELFLTAVSYYDIGQEEKYYHNLMLGFSFGLEEYYIIKSNREYGTGRVDLLLKSKDGKLPDYIFEFKVSKNREKLKIDAKKALEQIANKNYGIEVDNPVKIGMSFYGKEIEILIKE